MLRRILTGSRYLVIIAVIGSFLAAVSLLIYGGLLMVGIIYSAFTHLTFTSSGAKYLEVKSIEVIDLFLLATVLYIVALGLYELFIDEDIPVLPWLVISNLDDLKSKLIGVITVLLAVTFLAYVVEWDGNTNILSLGVSIGLVLFSLGYFFNRSTKGHKQEKDDVVDDSGIASDDIKRI